MRGPVLSQLNSHPAPHLASTRRVPVRHVPGKRRPAVSSSAVVLVAGPSRGLADAIATPAHTRRGRKQTVTADHPKAPCPSRPQCKVGRTDARVDQARDQALVGRRSRGRSFIRLGITKALRCDASSSFSLIDREKPATLRHKGDHYLWCSVGGFLISINFNALKASQRCSHEKFPY